MQDNEAQYSRRESSSSQMVRELWVYTHGYGEIRFLPVYVRIFGEENSLSKEFFLMQMNT